MAMMIKKNHKPNQKKKSTCNFFWSVLFCPYGNENLRSSSADYLVLFSLPPLTHISWRERAMDDFAKLEINTASDFFSYQTLRILNVLAGKRKDKRASSSMMGSARSFLAWLIFRSAFAKTKPSVVTGVHTDERRARLSPCRP